MRSTPIYKLAAAIACALLLLTAGCARMPAIGEPPAEKAERAEALAARGDYAAAARLYAAAAKSSRDDERDRLYLAAGEAAVRAGDIETAEEMLDEVDDDDLNDNERARLRLANTEVRIAGLPPARALDKVPPPNSGAPPEVAARTWKLRARLLGEQGRVLESVHALVQRDIWLPGPERAKANDERIWEMLTERTPEDFDPEALDDIDTTTRGWVALARIASRAWPDRGALEDALIDWERRYPGHPAARTVLPEKFDYSPIVPPGGMVVEGRDLGLALPLTGRFAEPATALRNGFLAAYYASEPPRPRLRLYDTNAVPGMAELINRARTDGVGLLVGPLSKAHVAELREIDKPRIPILALNYADEAAPPSRSSTQASCDMAVRAASCAPTGSFKASRGFPGFYQFGLAPEDEAEAAAERAVAMGWRRALALVPDGEWGERILSAFRDSMYLAGGELVDYAMYDPRRQDFSGPIKTLLKYREIEEKEDEEESGEEDGETGPDAGIPAEDIEATGELSEEKKKEDKEKKRLLEHGRRHDADFIFIAARPPQARLIRSQLRFYHAMHLPVMATSHAYGGHADPARDSDLNGLMFPDMPWILAREGDIAERRARLERLWPDASNRYPRLFALGQDAWRLQTLLRDGDMQWGRLFPGYTGELYLYPDGEIHRTLDWARFVRGRPRPLPAPPIATGDVLFPYP